MVFLNGPKLAILEDPNLAVFAGPEQYPVITLIQCELSVFVIWVDAATSGHIMDTVFEPEANAVLYSVAEAAKAHGQRIYEGLNFHMDDMDLDSPEWLFVNLETRSEKAYKKI